MSDTSGDERPAMKASVSKAATKKTTTKKVAARKRSPRKERAKKARAKKATAKKATAKKALPGKRVISERPPARREPRRGGLRDRLRTASVTGADGGDPDVDVIRPSRPAETIITAPRRGAVAVSGSRRGNLVRELEKRKRVVTGPGGKAGTEQTSRRRDETFRKVLASRDVQVIAAESLKRLEDGRLSDIETGSRAAEAELKGLRNERERLEKEQDVDKLALIDGYIRLAEAEAQAGQAFLRLAERARAQKGVITLIGRVLTASGKPPADAQIFFVDESDEVVREIEPLEPDADGLIWIGLNEDQAKSMIKRGGRLSARARVARKVVAADPFTARVTEGSVYQFDLRIKDDGRDRPGKPPDRPGRENDITPRA